jgi:protein-tyrosine phosphatase
MIITPDSNYPLTEILRTVWLGNWGDGAKLSLANPKEIEFVLNLSAAVSGYDKNPLIEYVEVPIRDGHELTEEEFWAIVNPGVAAFLAKKNILIHCMAGRSRSPGLLAAILAKSGKLEFDHALAFITRLRPVVQVHPNILLSVRKHLKIWPYSEGWTQK